MTKLSERSKALLIEYKYRLAFFEALSEEVPESRIVDTEIAALLFVLEYINDSCPRISFQPKGHEIQRQLSILTIEQILLIADVWMRAVDITETKGAWNALEIAVRSKTSGFAMSRRRSALLDEYRSRLIFFEKMNDEKKENLALSMACRLLNNNLPNVLTQIYDSDSCFIVERVAMQFSELNHTQLRDMEKLWDNASWQLKENSVLCRGALSVLESEAVKILQSRGT